MSIYCTILQIADDDAPIIYQGSHVLPSDDDERGGYVSLGAIPDHITRDGRYDAPEGSKKPWLRLSVNDSTVVLTRGQVERLHATLAEWLNERGAA